MWCVSRCRKIIWFPSQMRDMQAAVKLMEATHREAFDADRIKYEEEIASLRRILDGVLWSLSCSVPR